MCIISNNIRDLLYVKPAVLSFSLLFFLGSSWFIGSAIKESEEKKIRIVAILILIKEWMESRDALKNRNNCVLFDLRFFYEFLITDQ